MSRNCLVIGILILCLLTATTKAQTPSAVVGAGYNSPLSIYAAPGQVITLFVYGVGKGLSGRVEANRLPLPTTLAGISVLMEQFYTPNVVPVPIFSVQPLDICEGSSPCEVLTAITVQIPVEMAPNISARPPNAVGLTVSEGGKASKIIPIIPVYANPHILRTCDTIFGSVEKSCGVPFVTHASGELVSSANPAKPNEVLVMYLVGFRALYPEAKTGEPTPSAGPTGRTPILFDFRANALATEPGELPPDGSLPPNLIYVGLVPGLVGVFQINFRVPDVPAKTPHCDGVGVKSNLTVSIGGPLFFDGAGICVQVPN